MRRFRIELNLVRVGSGLAESHLRLICPLLIALS
jgi:hypothetical protein